MESWGGIAANFFQKTLVFFSKVRNEMQKFINLELAGEVEDGGAAAVSLMVGEEKEPHQGSRWRDWKIPEKNLMVI